MSIHKKAPNPTFYPLKSPLAPAFGGTDPKALPAQSLEFYGTSVPKKAPKPTFYPMKSPLAPAFGGTDRKALPAQSFFQFYCISTFKGANFWGGLNGGLKGGLTGVRGHLSLKLKWELKSGGLLKGGLKEVIMKISCLFIKWRLKEVKQKGPVCLQKTKCDRQTSHKTAMSYHLHYIEPRDCHSQWRNQQRGAIEHILLKEIISSGLSLTLFPGQCTVALWGVL